MAIDTLPQLGRASAERIDDLTSALDAVRDKVSEAVS